LKSFHLPAAKPERLWQSGDIGSDGNPRHQTSLAARVALFNQEKMKTNELA
jgi:hypothetical protein